MVSMVGFEPTYDDMSLAPNQVGDQTAPHRVNVARPHTVEFSSRLRGGAS